MLSRLHIPSVWSVCTGKALTELEELLLESVASEQEAAKLCAAQWASKLFPISHVPSRYVCVMAAGDAKLEVREAGSVGLRMPPLQSPGKSCLSPPECCRPVKQYNMKSCNYMDQPRHSWLAGSQEPKPLDYPTPDAVIRFFSQKHPSLRTAADMGKPLALPHRSFEALVCPLCWVSTSLI